MNTIHKHDVVCFGEVLWDILPSGSEPGGAPVNVAYHLNKQTRLAAVITRIGNDDDGKRLSELFSQKGIATRFFQVDEKYETGKVYATPDEHNNMIYDIVKPAAWDYIMWDDSLEDLVRNAKYFVYGSLAARNEVSKKTLFRLLEAANKKVLDINLRAPHFNKTIVTELLKKADILKMNREELELISDWFSYQGSTEEKMRSFTGNFGISDMIVTMGANGAQLYTNNEFYIHKGFKVKVADTVGSGDAFLAGLLSCFVNNMYGKDALEYASRLGAFVATRAGACPDYNLQDIYNIND